MNYNTLIDNLSAEVKTLIVIDTKYHELLIQKLLHNDINLFNISFMSINSFFKHTLGDNNIFMDEELTIIEKLIIHKNLNDDNHSDANNINFINELAKLKKEFNLSNIDSNQSYAKYFNTFKLDFSNTTTTFEKIIILSYQDFYPIHYELLNNLNVTILDLSVSNIDIQSNYFEHSNTIKMLDYIVYELYKHNNNDDSILLICDDYLNRDYLANKFDELGISYSNIIDNNFATTILLKSVFNFLNQSYSDYDLENLSNFNKLNLIDDLKSIDYDNYHNYINNIYHIFVKLDLFDLNYLNKLFPSLYLETQVSISLLNTLLVSELSSRIKADKEIITNIVIADSLFTALNFDKVYIVDAALKLFKPQKASYLLSTAQRSTIDENLISNINYTKMHHLNQKYLLNCGQKINFHYMLLDIKNSSQDLAYFIKLQNNLINNDNYLTDLSDFKHLSTHQLKIDSLLLNNEVSFLDKNNLATVLYKDNKLTLSASALDSFFTCPYQYYVSYILKPNRPNKFDSILLGNLYHKIIEQLNIDIINTYHSYTNLVNSNSLAYFNNIVKTNFDLLINDKLISSTYYYYCLNVINKTIALYLKSMLDFEKHSCFKLISSEQALSYDINDNTKFFGKIDALYNYNDSYFIVDYKSSAKEFKYVDFYDGISNQLVAYLALLKENSYFGIGAFYKSLKNNYQKTTDLNNIELNQQLHLQSNRLTGLLFNTNLNEFDDSFIDGDSSVISTAVLANKKNKVLDETEQYEYLKVFKDHCQTMISSIENGEFIINPYEKSSCNFCMAKSICKFNGVDYRKGENVDEL